MTNITVIYKCAQSVINFIAYVETLTWNMVHWKRINDSRRKLGLSTFLCRSRKFSSSIQTFLCARAETFSRLRTLPIVDQRHPLHRPRLATLFYTLTHKVSLRAVSINLYANKIPVKLREYTSTWSVFDKHVDKNDDVHFTA